MKLSQLPVDMMRHISTFTGYNDLGNLSLAGKSIHDDLNYELDRRKKEYLACPKVYSRNNSNDSWYIDNSQMRITRHGDIVWSRLVFRIQLPEEYLENYLSS